MRIATYGKTLGCDGCSFGTYHHSEVCRERFDSILDEQEPLAKRKPDSLALTSPITGRALKEHDIEQGHEVAASIYLQSLDDGLGDEKVLSSKLAHAMSSAVQQKTPKQKKLKGRWFVEFCCAERSSCCRVAEEFGINYLGLTEEFGDLTDPNVVGQILFWFKEKSSEGFALDLWGSIPCGPYSPLQNLNRAIQGEGYDQVLENKRKVTDILVEHFQQLATVAEESGGSVSFEWPLRNRGWEKDEIIQMIVQHQMYSCYPSGCGMGLEIEGKFPLKEWRILTTRKRLAVHLDGFRCNHPPDHKHDPIEGGSMARNSGIYNVKMAVAIFSGLYPEMAFKEIPSMPVVHGSVAHEQRGLAMAQIVLGMIHAPVSRSELLNHPQGRAKILEEANEMRNLQVWGETEGEDLFELDVLKKDAQQKGETIHIAEVMPIGSIKHAESKSLYSQTQG